MSDKQPPSCRTHPGFGWVLAGVGALALLTPAGCSSSRLPRYAKGSVSVVAGREMPETVISYRQLSREDFRASEPPESLRKRVPDYQRRVGAATCGFIKPHARLSFRPIERGFEARAEGLQFRAAMDPDCSWWNRGDVGLPASYVLQHEQIHFAIFELEARRLNAEAAQIERQSLTRSSDSQSAVEGVEKKLRAVLEDAAARVQRRGGQFDEDTSMAFNRAGQEEWANRIEAELAQTSPE